MLPELNEKEARERIAGRIAADLEDGALVNLGIGIPQLIPNFMPDGVNIFLQTENGTIYAGPAKDPNDLRIIDAGEHRYPFCRADPSYHLMSASASFAADISTPQYSELCR